MFRFLRRHRWVLIAAMALTCISFVFFMGTVGARNGSAGGVANFGTIYGHELTGEEVAQAKRDFFLFYLINYGEWPDRNASITQNQIDQQTYLNLLFAAKAKTMGISVPDNVVEDAASQMLRLPALARAVGTPGQAVPMDKFQAALKQKGFTDADFQHSVRSQLTVEQLRISQGLAGSLVTPHEAAARYDHDYEQVVAQAVFFSTSNYLAQVQVPAGAVGQFFTNNLAYYRVPDRIQVNYVWFNVTNYLADAKAEVMKTNFEQTVDGIYRQYGATEFKDEKPEDAKVKIREMLIRRKAENTAAMKAADFRKVLYAMDPVKPENIITAAKQSGVTATLSAPFAQNGHAEDFANAPAVETTAYTLTADSPFSDMILGEDGIYLIGLAKELPSSYPEFADIRARVDQDFRMQSAIGLVDRAGTNFYVNASVQTAAGKTFAQVAVSEGHTPIILSPFSLSSTEVPEAGDRAPIGDLRQAAFTTAPGHVSRFMPTADGGFVLYVQRLQPADTAKKTAELPAFTSQMRRARENEAFNLWVNSEASRELHNIPAFQPKPAGAAN